jgi:tetratricopeptide (TPR) repeat protein
MAEGYGHYYQGDFPAARECAERAIPLTLEYRALATLSPVHLLSGIVSHALGDLREARLSLEQAVQVARESDQQHYEGMVKIFLGRLVIEEDASQLAAAEQSIIEGMKMVEDLKIRPPQAWGHLFLGETYDIAGKKRKALASLKKARQMCQEMGMDYWLARTEKALEKLKAQ